jgi:hypothetical protein
MFAFLRVVVFYLGFAALLTWGMFALGWADALEMPGFEGTRAPVVTTTTGATLPSPEPMPKASPSREVSQPGLKPEPQPEPKQEPKPESKRVVVDTPPPSPVPPVRTEVAVARPVVEPQRTQEPPRLAPPPTPPPSLPREAKAPEPVVAPIAPSPPPRAPIVTAQPPQSPTRTVDAAPVRPTPAPAPPRSPVTTETTKVWAPVHRIAGFGANALVEQLANSRRARDDIACVMFRNVVFKAGTTVFQPTARSELEQVAKALNSNLGQRVEVGSRLGPGRPMTSDPKLRIDRAILVRQSLVSLGVAPARLTIDNGEAYERVAEDVGRVNGGRVQSMGVCVHAT